MNKLFTDMGGNFKFQAQDSFLEYFFARLGDLQNKSHFLKKRHLYLDTQFVIALLMVNGSLARWSRSGRIEFPSHTDEKWKVLFCPQQY